MSGFSWRYYRFCPVCDLPYGRDSRTDTLGSHGSPRCSGSGSPWGAPPSPDVVEQWRERMRARIKLASRVE